MAHRLSTIRNVDVIYVFKDGKVVESGSHEELMKKKEHFYDMVMLQAFPGGEEMGGTDILTYIFSIIIANKVKYFVKYRP